jgi:pyridoxamine 5'-phosphate oxidase
MSASAHDSTLDPLQRFGEWLADAHAADIVEPDAMVVATTSRDLRPSARVVLLRGFDERGFVFFTNYESALGRDLDAVPFAAAVFHWGSLQRQVRVEGPVERVSPEESDAYFQSRPRGHRLSAWVSAQSSVVPDRAYLERRMAEFEARFAERDIERPPHWGGYRIFPQRIEFWEGRPDRLHDRIRYLRSGETWSTERLAP